MAKQEEIIRKAKEEERERIIALLSLWRDHQDMGTSISAGRLVRLAIREEQPTSLLDEEFMRMLVKDRYQGVNIYGGSDDEPDSKTSSEKKPTTYATERRGRSSKIGHTKGHGGARMGVGRIR